MFAIFAPNQTCWFGWFGHAILGPVHAFGNVGLVARCISIDQRRLYLVKIRWMFTAGGVACRLG
jgi:hypothetical protein